ncbi:MAG TPA: thioredoxin-like domain-containing protein [Candidatus Eremiobacteraceae bacterium]|nr:thioredoxin-like domain-containing protein [Candidatus Eremiobacteraceae bacterium]
MHMNLTQILAALLFTCLLMVSQVFTPSGQAGAGAVTLQRVLAASDWLNSKPSAQSVRGKVVLIDFYTFGCINCKNVQPNLRSLYRDKSRSDLVILSIHSPETAVERDRDQLTRSLAEQGVVWPVAVDNDFAIWNAYNVTAWPTQMIFDRAGHLRKTVIGDSQDDTVDATVDRLIREKGPFS